jgi:hypothetical protein
MIRWACNLTAMTPSFKVQADRLKIQGFPAPSIFVIVASAIGTYIHGALCSSRLLAMSMDAIRWYMRNFKHGVQGAARSDKP